MPTRIVTIVLNRIRYTASAERIGDLVVVSTGLGQVEQAIGDDTEDKAIRRAFLQLLVNHPQTPGVPEPDAWSSTDPMR